MKRLCLILSMLLVSSSVFAQELAKNFWELNEGKWLQVTTGSSETPTGYLTDRCRMLLVSNPVQNKEGVTVEMIVDAEDMLGWSTIWIGHSNGTARYIDPVTRQDASISMMKAFDRCAQKGENLPLEIRRKFHGFRGISQK